MDPLEPGESGESGETGATGETGDLGRHRRVRKEYSGIAGKQNLDATWLVAPTRIGYRLLGALVVVLAIYLHSELQGSLFYYLIPLFGAGVGLEGLVLRAQITDSGTLLRVHSFVEPQRIAIEPGMTVRVTESTTWWSKGLQVPCLSVENSEGTTLIYSSEGRRKKLEKFVGALYEAAEVEPPHSQPPR